MRFIAREVFIQPFAVLTDSGADTTPHQQASVAMSDGSMVRLSGTASDSNNTEMVSVTGILNQAFSSTPVIWESEMAAQYDDIGEALNQMASLDDDDHLKIEPEVYAAASFVAAGLLLSSAPAPHVFTHGPKSVVFNWIDGVDNLYLTISADKLSVLVSTPERIKTRVDLSAEDGIAPVRLLSSLSTKLAGQKVLMLPSGSSEFTDSRRKT
jgi:hypothetical protein